jgi:hypothetical protein
MSRRTTNQPRRGQGTSPTAQWFVYSGTVRTNPNCVYGIRVCFRNSYYKLSVLRTFVGFVMYAGSRYKMVLEGDTRVVVASRVARASVSWTTSSLLVKRPHRVYRDRHISPIHVVLHGISIRIEVTLYVCSLPSYM